MSHHPTQPAADATKPSRKKVTTRTIRIKKKKAIPITMITAYDYSSATLVDRAGIDMILVGDSLAQVMLGHDDTVSLTMDEMLLHCRSVAKGAPYALKIGDMPFMTYQITHEEAVRNAGRILKEGRMDAIKLEGGAEIAGTVRAITRAGIPVVGHVGFTPQTVSQLGGYRIQGRTADSAFKLYQDAMALQEAGCIAIVFEMVPADVATVISRKLTVPTIGIGGGSGCDGQVLVYHDMLGLLDKTNPRFLKRYANVGQVIVEAVEQYIAEVKERSFPAEEHTYPIKIEELDDFIARIEDDEAEATEFPI